MTPPTRECRLERMPKYQKKQQINWQPEAWSDEPEPGSWQPNKRTQKKSAQPENWSNEQDRRVRKGSDYIHAQSKLRPRAPTHKALIVEMRQVPRLHSMTSVTQHTRADCAKDPNCVMPAAQVTLVNNSFVKFDQVYVTQQGCLKIGGPGHCLPPTYP